MWLGGRDAGMSSAGATPEVGADDGTATHTLTHTHIHTHTCIHTHTHTHRHPLML